MTPMLLSPPGRRALVAIALGALLPGAIPAGAPTAGEVAPLTVEDVVRRFAGGAGEAELLELVRTHESVRFDLSPEMQQELRIAGIPDSVLRAMLARQQAARRVAADRAVTAAPAPPKLSVQLRRADSAPDDDGAVLYLPTHLPPPLAAALRLGEGESKIEDVGVGLLCRTQDHVPDHWRRQTPLGRDFVATPRHRLLRFASGAQPVREDDDAEGDADGLRLALPPSLDVSLEAGVAHDLSLVLALQLGGRFRLVTESRLDGVVLEGDRSLAALVTGGRATGAAPIEILFAGAEASGE